MARVTHVSHFYSDPHFGHRNILEHAKRPFGSLDEMHEQLIARYNARVHPNDVAVWCGDAFFMPPEQAAVILDQMYGFKMLVLGNHDGSKTRALRCGFDVVTDVLYFQLAGVVCKVSHYPYVGMEDDHHEPSEARAHYNKRPGKDAAEVLIHGHTHSRERRGHNSVHVGVDAWDYAPASIEEVERLVVQQPAALRSQIEGDRLAHTRADETVPVKLTGNVDWLVALWAVHPREVLMDVGGTAGRKATFLNDIHLRAPTADKAIAMAKQVVESEGWVVEAEPAPVAIPMRPPA